MSENVSTVMPARLEWRRELSELDAALREYESFDDAPADLQERYVRHLETGRAEGWIR